MTEHRELKSSLKTLKAKIMKQLSASGRTDEADQLLLIQIFCVIQIICILVISEQAKGLELFWLEPPMHQLEKRMLCDQLISTSDLKLLKSAISNAQMEFWRENSFPRGRRQGVKHKGEKTICNKKHIPASKLMSEINLPPKIPMPASR